MIPASIFFGDTGELTGSLRISRYVQGSDTEDVLRMIFLDVRRRIYSALGAARIAEIVAMAEVQSPASDDEITRASAKVLEYKLCLLEAMRYFHVGFKDGASSLELEWDATGPTLPASSDDYYRLRSRLESDVEQLLEALGCGGDQCGALGTAAQCFTLDPTYEQPYPGFSLRNT